MEFRIPNHIWHVLYAIAALAAASIGCHAGLTGASKPQVVMAFVLIISVVMLLMRTLTTLGEGRSGRVNKYWLTFGER